jgi:hypothetical protein
MVDPKELESYEIIVSPAGVSRHLLDETRPELYKALGPTVGHYRNSIVGGYADLTTAGKIWLAGHWPNTINWFDRLPYWYADMTPVGGGVLFPFDTYEEALDAEIAWLKAHNLPLPVRTESAAHGHT